MQHLRILLQQKESGFYFSQTGVWSPGSAEAMDFLSSSAALDFCIARDLSDVQLVLKFPEQRYEIVIPLLPLPEVGSLSQTAPQRANASPA